MRQSPCRHHLCCLFAFFFCKLYICLCFSLAQKGAEELLHEMKERRELKEPEEHEERDKKQKGGICLTQSLSHAVRMAHYGPICV